VRQLSIMMSEIWGISLSFCLLVGFGADVYAVVWSSKYDKCCLHIIFLNLLRSVSDIELDSNVNK